MENRRVNVLITRPHAGLDNALPMLPSNRFRVYPCPTITTHVIQQDPRLDQILARIAAFDFLVFTSQIAVVETFEHLRRIGIDPRQLYRISICAVGPVVSQQLNKFGLTTNVMPNRYTEQALADLFPHMRTRSPKVLFPRGSMSAMDLEEELKRKGYNVVSPVLYDTNPLPTLDKDAGRLIYAREVDCLAFTCPSSVMALRSLLGVEAFTRLLKDVTITAIDPITSMACLDAGLTVKIQPVDYTLQTMARAIAHYYARSTTTGLPRRKKEGDSISA